MNQRFDEQTYYEILEISPDSPEHEVHKAYQKAKRTYSPESPALYTMFTPDEATELSRLIEEAYAVLSNHATRRDYDNRILGRSSAPTKNQPVVRQTNLNANVSAKNELKARNLMPTDKVVPAAPKVPEGYARTKFSVHEVNNDLESEIENCENFNGEFLHKIRTYKQINLETLSQDIRVSKSYLVAVEKSDYDALPADVFVRGFIVQYAKALGLDSEKVAKSYMKIMKDAKKTNKFKEEVFITTSAHVGQRADVAVAQHPLVRTRSQAARLFSNDLVLLNDKPVRASYKIRTHDRFVLRIPIETVDELTPYEMKLEIYYEDDDLIVVNKPAGIVVHPSAGHFSGKTLVNALLAHCKNLSMGFAENRPGIVHRLDKDTSGLLVAAKNNPAHEGLAKQFKEKTTHRVYKALVYGVPKTESATLTSYLIRHPVHRKKFCSEKIEGSKTARGKWACTEYKLMSSFQEEISLLYCQLQTGRTHQIRVHMSEMGHPIIADPIYSKAGRERRLKNKSVATEISSLQRIGLHAFELGFKHPSNGKEMFFQCPWPADLIKLVTLLGFEA